MTSFVPGFDVTGDNLHAAPAPDSGLQAALYVTGTGGVAATPSQLAMYPTCLRIAQWPAVSVDEASTPDYFDLENGAITTADLTALIPAAISAFNRVTRPGQRWPAVYCGDNTSPTAVANTLNAAGLGSQGVGLVLVDWSLTESEAAAKLSYPASSTNPYPVVGVQYANHGIDGQPYDLDVYAQGWVDKVSTLSKPVSGTESEWLHCSRCAGLFRPWVGNVCPAGGPHNGVSSYDYRLDFTRPA